MKSEIFKNGWCPECKKSARVTTATQAKCKKCGGKLSLSETWSIRYKDSTGERVTERIGPIRDHAVIRLGEVKKLIAEGGVGIRRAPKTSWAVGAAKLEEFNKQDNLTKETRDMYITRLAVLKAEFEGKTLDEITEGAVIDYRNKRLSLGLAPSSINKEVTTLRKLLRVAIKFNLLDGPHPLAELKDLKAENKRTRTMAPEEYALWLAKAVEKKKHKAIMAVDLVLETGLRRKSTLTLRWDEFNKDMTMIDGIDGEGKPVKGGKKVKIPIPPHLKKQLMEYRLRYCGSSAWVFPTARGKDRTKDDHIKVTSRIGFESICLLVGIKGLTFHDLRHTFATNYMRDNDWSVIALRSLVNIMGHSMEYMTHRYINPNQDDYDACSKRYVPMRERAAAVGE